MEAARKREEEEQKKQAERDRKFQACIIIYLCQ